MNLDTIEQGANSLIEEVGCNAFYPQLKSPKEDIYKKLLTKLSKYFNHYRLIYTINKISIKDCKITVGYSVVVDGCEYEFEYKIEIGDKD